MWPIHCEIGSWGHNVHDDVRAAYKRWEESTLGSVNKVAKGANPWTEHYSAVQAEVPYDDDDSTQAIDAFIATLANADQVYIAGEAGSDCVRATTEDLVANWHPAHLARLVLVTDCMSAVADFEGERQRFIAAMKARGLQVASSADVLAELLHNGKR